MVQKEKKDVDENTITNVETAHESVQINHQMACKIRVCGSSRIIHYAFPKLTSLLTLTISMLPSGGSPSSSIFVTIKDFLVSSATF